jgi:hypothetical protein
MTLTIVPANPNMVERTVKRKRKTAKDIVPPNPSVDPHIVD